MPTMTLDVSHNTWSPVSVTVTAGGFVTFKTSDESQQTVEIVPPGGNKFNYTIPADWTPPGVVGDTYAVNYNYKGGVTTGHVNIGVGGGKSG